MITSLSTHVQDTEITEGTMNGGFFVCSVEHNLLPVLQPFNGRNAKSFVVFYNEIVHYINSVPELIHGVKTLLCILPAYSLYHQKKFSTKWVARGTELCGLSSSIGRRCCNYSIGRLLITLQTAEFHQISGSSKCP